MTSTFISHSTQDRYFVKLLVALLEYHEVGTWWSDDDLPAGSRFRVQLDAALDIAATMIVVVSQHATASKWIVKEVTTFQTKQPEAPIIPVLLDGTSPDAVLDRLTDYQALDFTRCMLTGFDGLLTHFGKEFLPRVERRMVVDRRSQAERRMIDDRRVAPVVQRMRIGFWKAFAGTSGIGKFDPFRLGVNELFKTIEALAGEAAKYDYVQADGQPVDSRDVLERAANEVWDAWRARHFMKAVYVVEAIAEQIDDMYTVTPFDRRTADERRVMVNRRGT
jgi:TIR domain